MKYKVTYVVNKKSQNGWWVYEKIESKIFTVLKDAREYFEALSLCPEIGYASLSSANNTISEFF